jgi:hypothetical protein
MGNINPDYWLTLGLNLALYSGIPYTETTGTDTYHTGLGNARPAGIGRNTLESAGTAQLDLQWNHNFQITKATGDKARFLSPGLAAFNVFNHTIYQNYVGTLISPLFRLPTAAMNGRQMQLTMGYRF